MRQFKIREHVCKCVDLVLLTHYEMDHFDGTVMATA
jgi:phosphoribosyl 1,2-cyclic phosphodiesterase